MYNGLINVYKEPGFTSMDAVAVLRGILKQKKIGHTGTLDPAAEGVLMVCLGNATKLCSFLEDKDKEYECRMLLGVETDTDDIEFFASSPPFSKDYIKPWAEPFAFKVRNTDHLKNAISLTKQYADRGLFNREPIAWELWQVIQATPLNNINYHNYVAINDYTCDIDSGEDAKAFEKILDN